MNGDIMATFINAAECLCEASKRICDEASECICEASERLCEASECASVKHRNASECTSVKHRNASVKI